MILKDLWIGADFCLKENSTRYCLIEYEPRANECVAIKIAYDEPKVTGNTAVSFPFDTEVIYLPRKERLI